MGRRGVVEVAKKNSRGDDQPPYLRAILPKGVNAPTLRATPSQKGSEAETNFLQGKKGGVAKRGAPFRQPDKEGKKTGAGVPGGGSCGGRAVTGNKVKNQGKWQPKREGNSGGESLMKNVRIEK